MKNYLFGVKMYCNYCGEKLDKNAKFCSKCGHNVDYSSRVNSIKGASNNTKNIKHSKDLWNSDSNQQNISNVKYLKPNNEKERNSDSNQKDGYNALRDEYIDSKTISGESDSGPAKVILAIVACCCIGLLVFGNLGSLFTPDQNTESLADSSSSDNSSVGSVSEDGSDTSNDNSESSTPRLGSKKNPKTTRDYVEGSIYDINPFYGDYYYLDGTLWRDDNKYLGGAGTYTYISGKDPYADTSSSYSSSKSGSSSSSSSSSYSYTTKYDNEPHKYFSSKRSNKFHETWCSQGSRIKKSNRVYYNTRRQALNDGKKPCKHCQP